MILWVCVCEIKLFGELAQLARASALHAGGQGFESLILHHYEINPWFSRVLIYFKIIRYKLGTNFLTCNYYNYEYYFNKLDQLLIDKYIELEKILKEELD